MGIAEKKSNLKTSSKLKEHIINNTQNRDKTKNVNNLSGQRTVNGHRDRDENDGKDKLLHQKMTDSKTGTDDKTTESGESKLLPVKRNIPSHLTKKTLPKQGSTELSLLPTNKVEPLKIERKQTRTCTTKVESL